MARRIPKYNGKSDRGHPTASRLGHVTARCPCGIAAADGNVSHVDVWRESALSAYGQRIADTFNMDVYHHRLWLGPGNNVPLNTGVQPRR